MLQLMALPAACMLVAWLRDGERERGRIGLVALGDGHCAGHRTPAPCRASRTVLGITRRQVVRVRRPAGSLSRREAPEAHLAGRGRVRSTRAPRFAEDPSRGHRWAAWRRRKDGHRPSRMPCVATRHRPESARAWRRAARGRGSVRRRPFPSGDGWFIVDAGMDSRDRARGERVHALTSQGAPAGRQDARGGAPAGARAANAPGPAPGVPRRR